MFKATGKGFHISFANGYTLSVQFGTGNYCENRNGLKDSSSDAEVAVWPHQGDFLPIKDEGEVMGWVSPDDVIRLAAMVAAIDPVNPPTSIPFERIPDKDGHMVVTGATLLDQTLLDQTLLEASKT